MRCLLERRGSREWGGVDVGLTVLMQVADGPEGKRILTSAALVDGNAANLPGVALREGEMVVEVTLGWDVNEGEPGCRV